MSRRVVLILGLIAWGAFAFGAVYPWAYVPLLVGCMAVGASGLLPRNGIRKTTPALVVSLVLLMAAIGVQLIPLSIGTIRSISPETDVVLQRYAVGYPVSVQAHPLSIRPILTATALAAAVALAVFFLGLARSLTRDEALQIVRGVTVVGAALAMTGIIQKALWNGRIYGFWTPFQAGDSFGPFVNRNHFAGWMLMALPLAAGYFCGRVSRGMGHVRPGFRNRVLWFSTADASETILIGFAVLLMALGLTLTLSRSAVLGVVAAAGLAGWFVVRRAGGGSQGAIVAGYLTFVVIAAGAWVGVDSIAARFTHGQVINLGGRRGIWADAWHVAGRFPLAGTGLNTFGEAALFYQTANPRLHFEQAHSDYLQLLAEGGLLVCVPAILAFLALVWTVRAQFRNLATDRTDYWIRVGAVTGLVAIALQEAADFSLQMPGNAVLLAVLIALAIRPPLDRQRRSALPLPPP